MHGLQGPQLPSGPLQNNVLTLGAGNPGGTKAALDHASMGMHGCDG